MPEETISRRSILKKGAATTLTAGGVAVVGTPASAGYDNKLYLELDGSQGDFYLILEDHLGDYTWTQGGGTVNETPNGATEVAGSLDDGGWFDDPNMEATLEFSNDNAASIDQTWWDQYNCNSNVSRVVVPHHCHDDEHVDAWMNGSCVTVVEDDYSCNP